jgi:hypothetical protein
VLLIHGLDVEEQVLAAGHPVEEVVGVGSPGAHESCGRHAP